MPIRFRCVYCDQLLGIAKRKAGTVVKCPNCAGQIVVPAPDGTNDVGDDGTEGEVPTAPATDAAPPSRRSNAPTERAPAPKEAAAAVADGGMLFERSDFDELLKPALERKPSVGKTGSATAPRKLPGPSAPPVVSPAPQPAPPPVPAPAFDFTHVPLPTQPQPQAMPAAPPVYVPVVAPRPAGIVLTPLKMLLLAMLMFLAMGLTFAGGLVLGLYLGKS